MASKAEFVGYYRQLIAIQRKLNIARAKHDNEAIRGLRYAKALVCKHLPKWACEEAIAMGDAEAQRRI